MVFISQEGEYKLYMAMNCPYTTVQIQVVRDPAELNGVFDNRKVKFGHLVFISPLSIS